MNNMMNVIKKLYKNVTVTPIGILIFFYRSIKKQGWEVGDEEIGAYARGFMIYMVVGVISMIVGEILSLTWMSTLGDVCIISCVASIVLFMLTALICVLSLS